MLTGAANADSRTTPAGVQLQQGSCATEGCVKSAKIGESDHRLSFKLMAPTNSGIFMYASCNAFKHERFTSFLFDHFPRIINDLISLLLSHSLDIIDLYPLSLYSKPNVYL